MKKTALLLGALLAIGSSAYAKEVLPVVEEVQETIVVAEVAPEPMFRVTSFGQGLEIDNTSGGENIGEDVFFSNSVGLAYGDDWTFGLMARKGWSMDTHNGIHSDGHRIDMDAWRNFENFSIGTRWRQEENYDRLYLRGKYTYGVFKGNMDVAYQSNNSHNGPDGWYAEGTPVAVTFGPLTAGYYFKTESPIAVGNASEGDIKHWYRHQLRLSLPLYQGEKLNLGVQYGWEFANNIKVDGPNSSDYYTYKHDSNSHIIWLNGSYKVTENLTIDGYYEYDMFKWEKEGNGAKYADNGSNRSGSKDSDRYYGEFYLGWTYTF